MTDLDKTPREPNPGSNEGKIQADIRKDPMIMGEPVVERVPVAPGVKTPVVNPAALTPVVNPMATPQPSQILSDEKKAHLAKLAAEAPTTVVREKTVAPPHSEVRVEVAPGMEHMADDKGQIAYATVVVSDKTIGRAAEEPLGSRRLADEQAAGRASLERKHGPQQLGREQNKGSESAIRRAAPPEPVVPATRR